MFAGPGTNSSLPSAAMFILCFNGSAPSSFNYVHPYIETGIIGRIDDRQTSGVHAYILS